MADKERETIRRIMDKDEALVENGMSKEAGHRVDTERVKARVDGRKIDFEATKSSSRVETPESSTSNNSLEISKGGQQHQNGLIQKKRPMVSTVNIANNNVQPMDDNRAHANQQQAPKGAAGSKRKSPINAIASPSSSATTMKTTKPWRPPPLTIGQPQQLQRDKQQQQENTLINNRRENGSGVKNTMMTSIGGTGHFFRIDHQNFNPPMTSTPVPHGSTTKKFPAFQL